MQRPVQPRLPPNPRSPDRVVEDPLAPLSRVHRCPDRQVGFAGITTATCGNREKQKQRSRQRHGMRIRRQSADSIPRGRAVNQSPPSPRWQSSKKTAACPRTPNIPRADARRFTTSCAVSTPRRAPTRHHSGCHRCLSLDCLRARSPVKSPKSQPGSLCATALFGHCSPKEEAKAGCSASGSSNDSLVTSRAPRRRTS